MVCKSYSDRNVIRSKVKHMKKAEAIHHAFQIILDEILENTIEGFCFEAHRAAKLDYFQFNQYTVIDNKFELVIESDEDSESEESSEYEEITESEESPESEEKPKEEHDIYMNDTKTVEMNISCPFCYEKKEGNTLMRHILSCKSRDENESVAKVEPEDEEKKFDLCNGIKENGVDDYDDVLSDLDDSSSDEKEDFPENTCRIVSVSMYGPHSCLHDYNMNFYVKEEVQSIDYAKLNGHLEEDNIDIDPEY